MEQFFDTTEYQRRLHEADRNLAPSFPEYGVKGIPAADIVGSMTFVRIFHRLGDTDGFLLVYKGHEAPTYARMRDRFQKSEQDARRITQLLAQARSALDGARRLDRTSLAWTESRAIDIATEIAGFPEEGPAVKFTEIERIVRGDREVLYSR